MVKTVLQRRHLGDILQKCYHRFLRATHYAIARIVTRVDHIKTVEVMIMKFSPYGSPIHLVFAGKFDPEILRVPP